MRRRVDQVLAGFAEGDAISNEVVALRDMLLKSGFDSDIFVDFRHVSPVMKSRSLPLESYKGTKDNLLIHHYSIGSPAVDTFLNSPAAKVLLYHNITPAHFFDGFDDAVAGRLRHAREELRQVLKRVDAAWSDSRFNAEELKSLGRSNVKVFPLLFDVERFDLEPDRRLIPMLDHPEPKILFVGRIVPNKRVEDLILAFAWYLRAIDKKSRLFLIGSERSCPRYYFMLRMLAAEVDVPGVCFQHFASPEGLSAYYKHADLFVTASEHEGYCLPLVEAMHKGVPVIAKNTGGIPEALGGAGVLYEDATPGELAELMNKVISDPGVRGEVLESQRKRMTEIRARRADEELKTLLSEIGW